MSHFDIAIVGLGAMGSASLYQLAKSGAKVVGIDRFAPPHAHGSTHGETRITRCAIGEGEALVPLALRSHEIWREIEAETGADLLRQTGSLIISKPDDTAQRPGRTGFLDRSIAAARRFGIDHEVLSSADIRRRFPNFQPDDDEIGYFEPGGGYLRVEACVAANLELAQRHGATLQLGCTVQSIEADGAGVHIRTDQGDVLADRVAVSVGAWAGQLLGPPFEAVLKPTRQVMHWFEIEPKSLEAWRHSPVFMWPHGDREDGFFYGFPSIDGVSMKTADEYYGAAADPDAIDREVPPAESERLYREHLAGRIAGLT
ncbi:MAG: N-methyl-L-tryptophan oxidase, partial [Alphaproteobacteria bacterium]|nr:N-methyl-L-tryptophan oxidase [Alphaproteobacteria bacterium]